MGWNDHLLNPEDICSRCSAPVNWEDAYEINGETVCPSCFDKMIDRAEATFESDR